MPWFATTSIGRGSPRLVAGMGEPWTAPTIASTLNIGQLCVSCLLVEGKQPKSVVELMSFAWLRRVGQALTQGHIVCGSVYWRKCSGRPFISAHIQTSFFGELQYYINPMRQSDSSQRPVLARSSFSDGQVTSPSFSFPVAVMSKFPIRFVSRMGTAFAFPAARSAVHVANIKSKSHRRDDNREAWQK